jgi:hypothetical protein
MFGEGKRPEAYVPLEDGRTIPVTVRGGGHVVATTINQSLTVPAGTSTMDARQMLADFQRQARGGIEQIIDARIVRLLQTGGLLNPAYMALDTFTLAKPPSRESGQLSVISRERIADMGDGYERRQPDGINWQAARSRWSELPKVLPTAVSALPGFAWKPRPPAVEN